MGGGLEGDVLNHSYSRHNCRHAYVVGGFLYFFPLKNLHSARYFLHIACLPSVGGSFQRRGHH